MDTFFTVPAERLGRDHLASVGGKGANLGELVRAGFPVPDGFVVLTAAYDRFVADNCLGETIARVLRVEDGDGAAIRAAFEGAPIPHEIEREIAEFYEDRLGTGAVAVRSSATAEDLPGAAFAGQQDTYLNVVGEGALLDAVRRCWASLWTDRAIAYRGRQGIDQLTVKLAVVVQKMVEAEVAGVLFTANPVTGKRRQAVIDASPGLGESVVSGAVNPDHFVVDTATGEILERRIGDKRVAILAAAGGGTESVEFIGGADLASVSEDQVRALAALGARVEEHYEAPQDTEWAIDKGGKIWLLQARPITTLFPLPEEAPENDDELRVYFSLNVAQGVYGPFTPMGLQAFKMTAGTALSVIMGRPPHNSYAGPGFLSESTGRLFIDVTGALRGRPWRRLLDLAARNVEARAAPLLRDVREDPRLSPVATSPWPVLRALFSVVARKRIPLRVAWALARPAVAWDRATGLVIELRAAGDVPPVAGAAERLDAAERLLLQEPRGVPLYVIPGLAAGLLANALAARLLGDLATEDEKRAVMAGLPHNPTIEMDLELWELSRETREDPASERALRGTPSQELARDYREGTLPPRLQTELAGWLSTYGHRGVAEIDLGLPRWSDDPTHVLGVLSNYLRLEDPEASPDALFRRAAIGAEETAAELARRASREGRLRGRLVGFFLGRARSLMGMREMPKFCFVLLFSRARKLLSGVGEDLAEAGRLEEVGDVFFLSLPEARAAVGGEDLRPLVRRRRADYAREMRRRHVPRVLLSDGTEPEATSRTAGATAGAAQGVLAGTPASGGTVSGPARVVLDPTGAHLEPGEVLVAPSTDPGWTPLFLTASGLVMEMGGAMSHGAIVAREYGIPAVVGVPEATERIAMGQEIAVDGSAGTVTPCSL
jgi:rifampicin phosphotransferase